MLEESVDAAQEHHSSCRIYRILEVEARNRQILPTPVPIQRGDSVRAKLVEPGLQQQDIADAVSWTRRSQVG